MNAELHFDDLPTLVLEGTCLVLGRHVNCDLPIRHDRVSKRHARFTRRDGQWYVEDLGSSNGVRVDGDKIKSETALHHGATLAFGPLQATFHDPATIPAKTPPRLESTPPPAVTPSTTSPDQQPPHASPATPPASRRGAPRATVRRGSKGTGLLVVTLIVFSALFVVIYVVYQVAIKPTDDTTTVTQSDAGATTPPESRRRTPNIDPTVAAGDDLQGSSLSDRERREQIREKKRRAALRNNPSARGDGSAIRFADSQTRDDVQPTSPDGGVPTVSAPRVGVGNEAPPPDPFTGLESSGNALRLGQLVNRYPNHPDSAAVRERLRATPVIVISWEGGLPRTAHETLAARMLLNCSDADRSKLEALGLGLSFVDCTLTAHYVSNYKTGLGRRIGNARLAPHPKTLEIQVQRRKSNDKSETVTKLEFKTPRISSNQFPERGFTDEEIWAMTIDAKLERLNRALSKLLR